MLCNTKLTFDEVRFDQENSLHLVVSLTAPKIDWQQKRVPICIVPVVDVSGSMQGDKLHFAKQSLLKLIDHLQPGDFFGVVVFSTGVQTLSAPAEITQTRKDELRRQVEALTALDMTNFSGGMLQGIELVNKLELPDGMPTRVIMFTDGLANRGVATEPADIVALAKKSRGKATISAFGYGSDANQEMLADLAKSCGGNYAFVKNPEDALTAFAKELGGLLSTYAQDIRVKVAASNGHKIEEVVSDVDSSGDNKEVLVKLPDILSEEVRHLVFAMTTSKQTKALPRATNLAEVTIEYELLDDTGKRSHKTVEMKAKISFVKEGDEQKEPNKEVDKIVGLAQLVKAQVEAEEHAQRGDYKGAVQTMDFMQVDFERRGLSEVKTMGGILRDHMANEQEYAAHKGGYMTSARHAMSRGMAAGALDVQEDFFIPLRSANASVGTSMSNDAQAAAVASFTGGSPSAPAPQVAVVSPGKIDPNDLRPEKYVSKKKGTSKRKSQTRW